MYKSSEFLSTLKKHRGIAKANKFQLTKIGGNVLNTLNYNPNDINDMSYFCEATNLPGRNLATQSFRTGSVSKEYIHSNNFNDTLNLTFNLTDDMFIKNFFDNWQDLIFPLVENQNRLSNNIALYPNKYVGEIEITKLSKDLKRSEYGFSDTYGIKLIEAFPKQVNPVTLSYSSTEVMKLQVSIAYSRWQRVTNTY
tara:strand:+ start:914 stop:1501 length:588 start_codon:yes stop_codon:yes gene_type:complete